jgi:integrase
MVVLRAKKATVYPQTHRSENVTWIVNVGTKQDGKADLRRFTTEEQATIFQKDWNAKLIGQNPAGLYDLSTLSRHEVLLNLEKLKEYGATLSEAVDFFLKHARPEKGKIAVAEAIQLFLDQKERERCSNAYIQGYRKTFFPPFKKAFERRIVSEISRNEVEKFIYSKTTWNPVTIRSHLQYLRTFFNFLIAKGYAKLNPFATIKPPKSRYSVSDKTITPAEAKKLLQYALDTDYKAECASMALVFFCGVRPEEVERVNWSEIDLERRRLRVEKPKVGPRRVNEIPKNAYEWLLLCKSKGRVAPHDYKQRMKRLRRRSGVVYPQNGMRHCFAGYHVAQHRDGALTAYMLGHRNPTLLYRTYLEMVTQESAQHYWDVVPDSVGVERQRQRQLEDNRQREEAEAESNCGKAIQDESGVWRPVMEENARFDFEDNLDVFDFLDEKLPKSSDRI